MLVLDNLVVGDVALVVWGVKLDEKPKFLEIFNPNFDKIDDFELKNVTNKAEIAYLAKFLTQNPQFMQRVVLKCQNEDIECTIPTLPLLREMLIAESNPDNWDKLSKVEDSLGIKVLSTFKDVYMAQKEL